MTRDEIITYLDGVFSKDIQSFEIRAYEWRAIRDEINQLKAALWDVVRYLPAHSEDISLREAVQLARSLTLGITTEHGRAYLRGRDKLTQLAERVASNFDESYKPGSLERMLGDAAREALK